MRFRNIVDQLHDDDRLANARTAEQADLAAFRVRGQQIDNLDAGDQLFGFRRLINKFRGAPVNW